MGPGSLPLAFNASCTSLSLQQAIIFFAISGFLSISPIFSILAGGAGFSSAAQAATARIKNSALANTVLQIAVNIDWSSLSAQRNPTGSICCLLLDKVERIIVASIPRPKTLQLTP